MPRQPPPALSPNAPQPLGRALRPAAVMQPRAAAAQRRPAGVAVPPVPAGVNAPPPTGAVVQAKPPAAAPVRPAAGVDARRSSNAVPCRSTAPDDPAHPAGLRAMVIQPMIEKSAKSKVTNVAQHNWQKVLCSYFGGQAGKEVIAAFQSAGFANPVNEILTAMQEVANGLYSRQMIAHAKGKPGSGTRHGTAEKIQECKNALIKYANRGSSTEETVTNRGKRTQEDTLPQYGLLETLQERAIVFIRRLSENENINQTRREWVFRQLLDRKINSNVARDLAEELFPISED